MGDEKIPLNVAVLDGLWIYDQLQIEEGLLRTSSENWCLINSGSEPAIVLGISANVHEHVHVAEAKKQNVSIIRRFSGGGTVAIDEETIFVTFIINVRHHPKPTPASILQWTSAIYTPTFSHPSFCIRENDYAIGQHKIGGNAQYLTKERWLHHTSFLWDFTPALMQLLPLPPKRPAYRENRTHSEFLTPLKAHYASKLGLIQTLYHTLESLFAVTPAPQAMLQPYRTKPCRRSASLLGLWR